MTAKKTKKKDLEMGIKCIEQTIVGIDLSRLIVGRFSKALTEEMENTEVIGIILGDKKTGEVIMMTHDSPEDLKNRRILVHVHDEKYMKKIVKVLQKG